MITSFVETVYVRAPQGMNAAMAEAAKRENITLAEFARRALHERIERAGVTPPALPPRKREG